MHQHRLLLILFKFFVLIISENLAAGEISSETVARIRDRYREIFNAVNWERSETKGEYQRLPSSNNISKYTLSGEGVMYVVVAPVSMLLTVDQLDLRGLTNGPLKQLLEKDFTSPAPKFSIEQALDQSRDYMNRFGIEIASNKYVLKDINFGETYPYCWRVRWERVEGGFPYDDFTEVHAQYIVTSFHETLGLVQYARNTLAPSPESLNVVLTAKQAIGIAKKCVPLVQRSLFYRRARTDGFVASSVESCELKIAVPNWLLDPAKAVWIFDKPPKETRLCWVVRLTTVDSIADKRGLQDKNGKSLKLIAPDIVVYVDAATGEVVGANFT